MIENLTHLYLLKVTGDDAEGFLQGQLSNDVTQLHDSWHYSAYCNPKGRVLALFQVWRSENSIFMLIEASLLETSLKRLRMYVMRSKVTIEHITDAQILGITDTSGTSINGLDLTPDLTRERYSASQLDNGFVLSYGERALLVNLGTEINATEGNAWIGLDIEASLPRVTEQSHELFIPQMLNLDINNGISFKKGCYTGQEIIARMRYLGKVKQRQFVCQRESPEHQIAIGDKVVNLDGKALGNVSNVVQGSPYLNAVLRIEQLETDQMKHNLTLENGAELRVLDTQPYSLDSD